MKLSEIELAREANAQQKLQECRESLRQMVEERDASYEKREQTEIQLALMKADNDVLKERIAYLTRDGVIESLEEKCREYEDSSTVLFQERWQLLKQISSLKAEARKNASEVKKAAKTLEENKQLKAENRKLTRSNDEFKEAFLKQVASIGFAPQRKE